ncbi:uncharacterized protein BDR25DRAFT_354850 [Lindgomyces ingoldianus]|uniref:Uncharacterized protein n=1 Tax=Lindgomyces ingoldianus TaxID=673940 RepID=A0ACB6QV66_9PLEO|nr:uncharacterized protein BDR25DRAFT_354850 [Lindgomyces ingoldianus]KAF2470904.1 hypothetical protein BDR25DRAFT_354850 [Lindgomyces ingoldianus]
MLVSSCGSTTGPQFSYWLPSPTSSSPRISVAPIGAPLIQRKPTTTDAAFLSRFVPTALLCTQIWPYISSPSIPVMFYASSISFILLILAPSYTQIQISRLLSSSGPK